MVNIEQLTNLLDQPISQLGYNLVQIKFSGDNYKTLQILIEYKDDTKISVNDCKIVSNNISAIIDVSEIIDTKYNLEVSSPGIERPLIKFDDFNRFKNNHIIVRLHEAINNCKTYKGQLIGAEDNLVILKVFQDDHIISNSKQQVTKPKKPNVRDFTIININFTNIKSSNIILTDELYRKILNKDK